MHVELVDDRVLIHARAAGVAAVCPLCGEISRRFNGNLQRRLADLRAHGWQVRLVLSGAALSVPVRSVPDTDLRGAVPASNSSAILAADRAPADLVRHLGLALSGRPAQALASRLLLPVSKVTRLLVDRFVAVVHNRTSGTLEPWLDEAATSETASFSGGLAADQVAVIATLTEPWSNGQTKGQINRLKALKRQMYGRANMDLLKARLVDAS